MRVFSYLLFAIIVVLGVTFAFLNAKPVVLNYYVGVKDVSLSLVIVISLGIGGVLGLFATTIPMIKLRHKNSKLKHKIKQIEQEVANLRSIPIKNQH